MINLSSLISCEFLNGGPHLIQLHNLLISSRLFGDVTVTQGIAFLDQWKLPCFIKILNTKCQIKHVKSERNKDILVNKETKFVKGREVEVEIEKLNEEKILNIFTI